MSNEVKSEALMEKHMGSSYKLCEIRELLEAGGVVLIFDSLEYSLIAS